MVMARCRRRNCGPLATMVPMAGLPPATPFTDQVTVVGKFPAPETVAVKD